MKSPSLGVQLGYNIPQPTADHNHGSIRSFWFKVELNSNRINEKQSLGTSDRKAQFGVVKPLSPSKQPYSSITLNRE